MKSLFSCSRLVVLVLGFYFCMGVAQAQSIPLGTIVSGANQIANSQEQSNGEQIDVNDIEGGGVAPGTVSIPPMQEPGAAQGKSYGIIPSDGELGGKLASGEITLNDIPHFFLYWIDWISGIAGTICVVMLVWGGMRLIASGVTEQKEEAKNTIKWAITGIVIVYLAWWIVNAIMVGLTAG